MGNGNGCLAEVRAPAPGDFNIEEAKLVVDALNDATVLRADVARLLEELDRVNAECARLRAFRLLQGGKP